jgi:hypothetical protein
MLKPSNSAAKTIQPIIAPRTACLLARPGAHRRPTIDKAIDVPEQNTQYQHVTR